MPFLTFTMWKFISIEHLKSPGNSVTSLTKCYVAIKRTVTAGWGMGPNKNNITGRSGAMSGQEVAFANAGETLGESSESAQASLCLLWGNGMHLIFRGHSQVRFTGAMWHLLLCWRSHSFPPNPHLSIFFFCRKSKKASNRGCLIQMHSNNPGNIQPLKKRNLQKVI